MSLFSEQLSQALAIVDVLAPSDQAAGTVNTTGGVDLSKFGRVTYLINVGAITGAGKLDAYLQYSANSNMSGATNVTNCAITQITNASPNCVVSLEVRADQVQQQGGTTARYLRCQTVVTTNNVLFGAVGLAAPAYYKPGDDSSVNATLNPQRVVCNT